jgi:hypothetical protein
MVKWIPYLLFSIWAVSGFALSSCGNSGICHYDTIIENPILPEDLPDVFGYRAADMRDAIGGNWYDVDHGVQLDVATHDIRYWYGDEGVQCQTVASLDVIGTLTLVNGSGSISIDGYFQPNVSYLDRAFFELFDINMLHDNACNLMYHTAAGTSGPRLLGYCNPSSLGLANVDLAFHR